MFKFQCLFIVGLILCSISSFSQALSSKLDSIVFQYYPNPKVPGIMLHIVGENNEAIYSKGIGVEELTSSRPIHSNSNFRMASVSKQFTALAISSLFMDKKLKFEQKISDFFPNLKGDIRNITILNLLNHTSGIIDYEALIPSDQTIQLNDSDVLEFITPIDTLYFPSGSKFRYSNTGYCLLSLIVEKISGSSFETFIKERIFKHLEMSNSQIFHQNVQIRNRVYGYHYGKDKFIFADQSITSATKGDGGVYTSANDFCRSNVYIKSVVNQLMANPEYNKELFYEINPGIRYGQGLFLAEDINGDLVYFHSGESTGFHNIMLMIPERNIYISLFSNRDDSIITPFFEEILKAMDIKIRALENKPLFSWLSDVYANKINEYRIRD